MSYTRFAIYYLPPKGELADFGATWLGWDIASGQTTAQPNIPGIEYITQMPRKYGFHGTLKPPFRLAQGCNLPGLHDAIAEMAAASAPAHCEGLTLSRLGNFLALTPVNSNFSIEQVAAACVQEIDAFRAPLNEKELKRRRISVQSKRQEALLKNWGYPFVLDEFRFHLTLTGPLQCEEVDSWIKYTLAYLPVLPTPFRMSDVALVGERPDGYFEEIQRYALSGYNAVTA